MFRCKGTKRYANLFRFFGEKLRKRWRSLSYFPVLNELLPDVARHHAVLFLKALGEVARSSESYGVGYLTDALVGGKQHLIGTFQARGAQQFDRLRACNLLHLTIELYTTEVHLCCEVVDADFAIF